MSVYVIGDVQGCYAELQDLLAHISFNPDSDQLGFVGDLINRGPDSLNTLRFIKNLKSPRVVLGNHDLYLLVLGYGLMPSNAYHHTLDSILNAPDKIELLEWLRHRPLIHLEKKQNALLVHAGLPPPWNISKSLACAHEVENALRGPHYASFLTDLFGDEPNQWHDSLKGQDRLRYIINALTRMRFCNAQGALDLKASGKFSTEPDHYQPWFKLRKPEPEQPDIIFGHWAALNGQCDVSGFHALDTGCAWGHRLTALRLEDKKRFSVPCRDTG